MSQSKFAPFKRLRDWEGQLVRTKREIRNAAGEKIPAGTECTVTGTNGRSPGGSNPAGLCISYETVYISGVQPSELEALTPPENTNLVTRYLARPSDKGKLEVHSCVFDKKPNSWRRHSPHKSYGDPFGYRTNFSGGIAPGFATIKEAVEFYVEGKRETVKNKRDSLAFAEHELAQVEAQAPELLK